MTIDDPAAAVRAVSGLSDRDQSYWYLGVIVTLMIGEKRDSDDPGDREFMRCMGEQLRHKYETLSQEMQEVLARFLRDYWLPR